MFGLDFALGAIVGAIIVGLIAHRKPEWFATIVKAANAVDDKVNSAIEKK